MTAPAASQIRTALRIGSAEEMAGASTRSHLPDGRCVGWFGPTPHGKVVVIDAELADRPVPRALAKRFGEQDFWLRWTRAECAAKLARIPIGRWLRLHGLDVPPGVHLVTMSPGDLGADVVVTVAVGSVSPHGPVGARGDLACGDGIPPPGDRRSPVALVGTLLAST